MDKYKEFQGRDLDECITQALKWFDAPREALEIEILQDAKSGIFGIVGARKAKIRARRAHVAETVRTLLEKDARAPESPAQTENQPAGERQAPRQEKPLQKPEKGVLHGRKPGSERRQAEASSRKKVLPESDFPEEEDAPGSASSQTDAAAISRNAVEIIENLLSPLADRPISAHVNMDSGKPRVRVDWEGDAGLLIGREGQTLAAIQYLASRILSRKAGAPINLQLDVGEYRTRQDDRLRELAFSLAEKVRATGRPLSTRPLSSYHRRVVHMCLQDEEDLQTRSTGDGPLKRVLISMRRS